jgi:hypothetical protein
MLLTSCSSEPLEPLKRFAKFKMERARAVVNYCNTDPADIITYVRIAVIVDHSGSNQDRATGLGSDPTRTLRYGSLDTWVNEIVTSGVTNTKIGLFPFSTNASNMTCSGCDPFIDPVQMQPIVQNQLASGSDGGWTNFTAALGRAVDDLETENNRLIAQINANGEFAAIYNAILFVSDGAPLVDAVLQPYSDIQDIIRRYADFKNNNEVIGTTLNTAYYYTTFDPVAEQYLKDMANDGNGHFTNVTTFNIPRYFFAVPDLTASFVTQEIFVKNMNTVWATDPTNPLQKMLHKDSDMDGASDLQETEIFGSSPTERDSDFNQVSDKVEFELTGRACADPSCRPGFAEIFPSCGADPVYRAADDDGDGLNNCEETLLGSEVSEFDSSSDWIPDILGFYAGMPFTRGSQAALLDPDVDKVTNIEEIRGNTSLYDRNDNYFNLRPTKYRSTVVSDTNGLKCYEVEVTDIATIGEGNQLAIYILENTNGRFSRPVLRSQTVTIPASRDFVVDM